MIFTYSCVYNESLETEDFETEKFEWHFDGTIEASCFEHFVYLFRTRYSDYVNQIEMWETDNEDSENGYIWASNSVDGLTLKFRVEVQE